MVTTRSQAQQHFQTMESSPPNSAAEIMPPPSNPNTAEAQLSVRTAEDTPPSTMTEAISSSLCAVTEVQLPNSIPTVPCIAPEARLPSTEDFVLPSTSRQQIPFPPDPDSNLRSSRTQSCVSGSSSAAVRARMLAARVKHARRLAEVEKLAIERKLEMERSTMELELQETCAAIEAEAIESHRGSHSLCSSRTSSTKVEAWLKELDKPIQEPTNAPFQPQVLNVTDASPAPPTTSLPHPSVTALQLPHLPSMDLVEPLLLPAVKTTAPPPTPAVNVNAPSIFIQGTCSSLDTLTSGMCLQSSVFSSQRPTPSVMVQPTLSLTSVAVPQPMIDFSSHVTSPPYTSDSSSYNNVYTQAPTKVAYQASALPPSADPYTEDASASTALPSHLLRPTTYKNTQITTSQPNSAPLLQTTESLIGTANNFTGVTSIPISEKSGKSDISELAQAILKLTDSHKHKLGDGSLPKFDAKPLEWLAFKRVFKDTEKRYSPSENITRITMALTGAARQEVAVLMMSARDPDDVMSALEEKFARPDLIVLSEIAAVRALPRLSLETRDLNEFTCRVRNCVAALKLLDHKAYLESPELYNTLVGKLTPFMRARFSDFATPLIGSNKTKLEMFAEFLQREINQQIYFGHIPDITSDNNKFRPRERINSTSIENKLVSMPCLYCQNNHAIDMCAAFKLLTTSDRWQWVREKKLCHRCLKKGSHRYRYCNAKILCQIDGCKYKHHDLLHEHSTEKLLYNIDNDRPHISEVLSFNSCNNLKVPVDVTERETSVVVAHSFTENKKILRPLLKVIKVSVYGPKGKVDTLALLDDGATATFVDSELSKQIGASGIRSELIDCIGGFTKETVVEYVDFTIKGYHTSDVYTIERARSIPKLGIASQLVCPKEIEKYPHLSDISHLVTYDKVKPMIIIGIDNWHLLISNDTRKGTRSQPVACLTPLGWVVYGFTNSRTEPVEIVNHCSLSDTEALIQDYYKLDSIGITKEDYNSKNDQRAIDILNTTSKRLPDGRFEVRLLWKADDLNIPDSYNLALSRLKTLEIKMGKNKEYAAKHRQNINEMIQKGYAELCTANSQSLRTWYLPHFGVINPNKPGKLRVVHDAAAKCQSVSLNSLLLPGPDLLQPLLDIILRFREGKVALTADIREMFPQITQRFLWRDTPNAPIFHYRMSSMIFGAASSPFTALFIKNKNATEVKEQYPDAVHAILFDHYMDDYIGSVDRVEEAATLARDIVIVHQRAHLEMRGWISNVPAALELIPQELRLQTYSNDINLGSFQSQSVRTLGLIWHPSSDTIGFNTGSPTFPDKVTKRVALSQLMRVFDPLGILAPLTVKERIMFQQIWRSGTKWDQELSQEEKFKWHKWHSDICSVLSLRIPRWYLRELDPIERELHVFSDASELAYAAVAYWRFLYRNGDIQLTLICSKARVAPLKPVTIPRLELQGALIAARLATTICKAHCNKPTKRIFWSDSRNVLAWLRNDARCFKPFVAHRVGEITELTATTEWRWVPSALNVADDATRLQPGGLSLESRWVRGPEYLLNDPSLWPKEPKLESNLGPDELKPAFRHQMCHTQVVCSITTNNGNNHPSTSRCNISSCQ